jgi:hypothetical protein
MEKEMRRGLGEERGPLWGPENVFSNPFIFSHGCGEDFCHRNIYPGCYVLNNSDSYSRLPGDIDQAVWLLFHVILVLIPLPVVIDYFNGCLGACSLGITAQIKFMREHSLVFSRSWFGIYLRMPIEKYKIISWKKK